MGVSGQRALGCEKDVRAAVSRVLDRAQDQSQVCLDISGDRELGQADSHRVKYTSSAERRKDRPDAEKVARFGTYHIFDTL